MSDVVVPEFSRLLSVARIPPLGLAESLAARPEERAALAKRFDLVEVKSLTARLEIKPEAQQNILVTGVIEAEVVQSCVVTLEPVEARITVEVDMVFVPADRYRDGAGDPVADELEEEIETFADGRIDLGEMVAQQMGIHIDPYPRKPGAALTKTEFGAKVEEPHPFRQLADAIKIKDKTDR